MTSMIKVDPAGFHLLKTVYQAAVGHHLRFLHHRLLAYGLLTLALPACSWLPMVGPDYKAPEKVMASEWHADPMASDVDTVRQEDLHTWWAQFHDDTLLTMIESAQKNSATVSAAYANIATARATLVNADALGFSGLSADASVTRSKSVVIPGAPAFRTTQQQIKFSTQWEIDLFGGLRREQEAANARFVSKQADLQDARLSVAAEVAQAYVNYRACQATVALQQQDVDSKTTSFNLTQSLTEAGFKSSADLALTRATVATARSNLQNQQAECTVQLKAMVALTGLDEPVLLTQLGNATANLPKPAQFEVDSVPTALLKKRPDLVSAERALAASSADIGAKEAERYPSVTLNGSVTPLRLVSSGTPTEGVSWSIGPTINIPIFDLGKRKAAVETAKAAFEAADAGYRSKARNAIKEVEQALVKLQSYNARAQDLATAQEAYKSALASSEARYKQGMESLIDVETLRRNTLDAEQSVLNLEKDRVNAWIDLYRAVGGGWSTNSNMATK